MLALGNADPQAQAKTQFILSAGRLQPQVSGLLIQADSVFQLDCGRPLSLDELQSVYSTPEFRSLLSKSTQGLGQVRAVLTAPFEHLPCKNKGR